MFKVVTIRVFYNKWGKEIKDHPKAFYKEVYVETLEKAQALAKEESSKNRKADISVLTELKGETWLILAYDKGVLYMNDNYFKAIKNNSY